MKVKNPRKQSEIITKHFETYSIFLTRRHLRQFEDELKGTGKVEALVRFMTTFSHEVVGTMMNSHAEHSHSE